MKKSTFIAPTLALGMAFGASSVSAQDHTVTIEAGDTLSKIAQEHKGVTLDDLYQLNPDVDPRHLSIGMEIKISENNTAKGDHGGKEIFHKVEPGETMESIANLHKNVTLAELYDWNPDIQNNDVEVGTKVRVQAPSYVDDNEQERSERIYHTIESGNTLANTAQYYEGVTLEQIYKLNPGIDPRSLTVGDKIQIRPDNEVKDENTEEAYHTIEAGNTLYSIANQYEGVSLQDLYDLNPGIEASSLKIGAEIRVK